MKLRPDVLYTVYKRAPVLQCLADGTTEKRTIATSLGVSRSTVDRAFNELEDEGVLDGQGSDYDFTLLGALLFERYQVVAKQYADLLEATSMLTDLPSDAPISFDLLSGADVYTMTDEVSSRAIFRVREHLDDITDIRTAMPVVFPSQFEAIVSQVEEGSMTGRIILDATQADFLVDAYPDSIETLQKATSVSLELHDDLLPFGVTVLDGEEVLVTVHAADDQFSGALVNSSDAAIEWGNDVLDALASTSRKLSTVESPTAQR